jgi:hypothetical protein
VCGDDEERREEKRPVGEVQVQLPPVCSEAPFRVQVLELYGLAADKLAPPLSKTLPSLSSVHLPPSHPTRVEQPRLTVSVEVGLYHGSGLLGAALRR